MEVALGIFLWSVRRWRLVYMFVQLEVEVPESVRAACWRVVEIVLYFLVGDGWG